VKDIILIYFIDLVYLIILQLVGHVFGKYCLKHRNNVLLNFVYGYFVVSSISAILTTAGFTIAWGVIAVLISSVIFRKSLSIDTLFQGDQINYKKDYIIATVLFTFCYLSRISVHFNHENGFVNIPFRDYVYYINHAEYIYLTGKENSLSSKNLLFENLNLLEPYRFQDAWPMSIFMTFTNFKSVDIYFLILFPVNFFLVAYVIYELLKTFAPNLPIWIVALLSFFFIFYQSSSIWPYKLNGMLMGLAGYPKLWIHYLLIGVCLKLFTLEKYDFGNNMLLLLFFTVPVTVAIPFYIIVYLVFQFIKNRNFKYFYIIYVMLILGYFIYIMINKRLEKELLSIDNSGIKINLEILSYLKAAGYNALFFSYTIPIVLVFIIIRYYKIELPVKLYSILPYIVILACGYIAYIVLHNNNDALQLFANIASPITAVLSFIGIVHLILNIPKKTLRLTFISILCGMLLYETIDAHISSKHYARHNISSMFDPGFISKAKNIISKTSNPVGIYYPDERFGMINEQFFRKDEINIIVLMGRYFDVVNIKGDSILFDENRYKEIDRHWHRMAINIYGKNHPKTSNLELAFIKDCNIEYMLTFKSNNELPVWLGSLVKEELYDKKSGLRIYLLHEPQ